MTSSLVGSEMCIRDSTHSLTHSLTLSLSHSVRSFGSSRFGSSRGLRLLLGGGSGLGEGESAGDPEWGNAWHLPQGVEWH
eukprot:11543190-Prorocentrum_lima.AAC.1